MSEVQNEKEVENQEQKEEFVSKKVYSEVSKDMLRYKQEKRELEAKLAEISGMREAEQTQKLEAEKRWEDLYKNEKTKRETLEKSLVESNKKFIDTHKLNSVVTKVGGLKKDVYSKFVDVSKIDIDEMGNINIESVEAEAQRLLKDYPEIIKGSNQTTKLPADSAKEFQPKTIKEMSQQEKLAMITSKK